MLLLACQGLQEVGVAEASRLGAEVRPALLQEQRVGEVESWPGQEGPVGKMMMRRRPKDDCSLLGRQQCSEKQSLDQQLSPVEPTDLTLPVAVVVVDTDALFFLLIVVSLAASAFLSVHCYCCGAGGWP